MKARIPAVDAFRVIGVFAVVLIHAGPFRFAGWEYGSLFSLPVLVNQTARFAVPLFFVLSGYFWGLKINAGGDVWRVSAAMNRRIVLLVVVWSLFYLLPFRPEAWLNHGPLGPVKAVFWNLESLLRNPDRLLFEGKQRAAPLRRLTPGRYSTSGRKRISSSRHS